MSFRIKRIALGNAFRWEQNGLCGQGAVVITISGRGQQLSFRVSEFGTTHQFHIMDVIETVVPFEHGFPCPLVGVGFCLFVHSAVGENGFLYTVNDECRILFLLAHGIAVVSGIAFQRIVVMLETVLCGQLQVVVELQFGIEDCHQRAVLAVL